MNTRRELNQNMVQRRKKYEYIAGEQRRSNSRDLGVNNKPFRVGRIFVRDAADAITFYSYSREIRE